MAESNATQVILTDDGIKIIKAQNTADNATGGVDNLNDPNLMNVIEKQTAVSQYAGLTSQYNVILERAKDANISTTALTAAYTKLNTFMAAVLADTAKASDVDRDTYKSLIDAYNAALSNVKTALSNSFNADIDNMHSNLLVASQAASNAVIVAAQAAETGDKASYAAVQAREAANQAQTAGNDATRVANNASQAASSAVIAGSTASVNADKAIKVANQAKIAGDNATNVASKASQAASSAVVAGSTATVNADKAIGVASQAKIAGDNANNVANKASQAASSAKSVADNTYDYANSEIAIQSTATSKAQSTADNAFSKAQAVGSQASKEIAIQSTATAKAQSKADDAFSKAQAVGSQASKEIAVQSTATAKAQIRADDAFSKAQAVGTQASSEIAVQSTATAKAQSKADDAFSKAQAVGDKASAEIAVQSTATAKAQSKADDAFSKATTAIDSGKVTSQAVTDLKDGSKLTIAELENGLATKVANSDYASYKEQTASQIGQLVTNGAFSAYQTTTADLIAQKVATKDFSAYQATTAKSIESKVDNGDFSTYKTQTADVIASKVANKDFSTYQKQTAGLIESKVDNGTFSSYKTETADLIASKVANKDFSTYQKQTADLIAQKVATKDFSAYQATTAKLIESKVESNDFNSYKEQTAKEFSTTIESVQTQVQDSAVGTNLIIQSTLAGGYIDRDKGGINWSAADFHTDYIPVSGITTVTISSPDYTFTYDANHTLAMYDANKKFLGWQLLYPTTTFNQEKVAFIRISINFVTQGGTYGSMSDWLDSHRYKLEKGSHATDYSVNPEDTATKSQITQLSGEIEQKVNSGTFSTYKTQTANLIAEKVANKDFSTYQKQTADLIESKVDNGTYQSDKTQTAKDIASKVATKDFSTYQTQTADVIASKVTNKDFSAYQDTTAKAISSKVDNGDFSTYKTQTADLIASKVANKGFSTYQKQTADLIAQKVATKDFSAYQATTAKAIESKVESKDFNTYKTQTANLIDDKVSSSAYASDKTQTASQIANMVSNSAFSTYQNQTASQIASKVDNGDFSTYKKQTADLIAQKVATKDFSAYQATTAKAISSKVESNDFNTYKTQTADTISSKVESSDFQSLQTQVDNSAVGTNLLTGTSSVLVTITNVTEYSTNTKFYNPNITTAGTYTARAYLSPVSHDVAIYISGINQSGTRYWKAGNTISAGSSGYSISTYTLPASCTIDQVYFGFPSQQSDSTSVSYKEFKLEKGSMATDWCPNSADIATQSQITQLSGEIDLRVTKGDLVDQINIQAGKTLISSSGQLILSGKSVVLDSVDPVIMKSANIGNLAVGTAQIANGAITDAKIGSLAVGTAQIKYEAVGAAQIAKLAVGTAQIDDAAITDAKIGKLAVGTAQIKDGAITSAQIGSLAVGTAQIKYEAVGAAQIAKLAVGTAQIGNGAITNAKIGKLAVGTAQIANAAITDAQVGNVSANKLTAGTIDFNTITGKNINASNITTGKLDTDRLNVNKLSALSADLGDVRTGSLKGVDIVAKTFSTPNGSFTADENGSVVASNFTIRGVTNLVYNAALLGSGWNAVPGWSLTNNGYCALNVTHDGVKSIGFSNTTGAGVWNLFAQTKLYPLNGVTGKPFSASVWFKEYGSDTSLRYQFTLAFFDSNGNRIESALFAQTWNGIGSKQDWRYVTVNNAVAPSNAVSVGLQYWSYNGHGNACFSSPMLTQTAQSTGYQPDVGNIVNAGIINGSTINGSTINGTTFNAGTKLNQYGNTSYPLTINQDGSVTSTSFGAIANDPAALRTLIKDGTVKTNFRGMKQLSTGAYPAADVSLGAGQLALLEGYSNSQDPNFTATGMKTTGYAILDASTGLSLHGTTQSITFSGTDQDQTTGITMDSYGNVYARANSAYWRIRDNKGNDVVNFGIDTANQRNISFSRDTTVGNLFLGVGHTIGMLDSSPLYFKKGDSRGRMLGLYAGAIHYENLIKSSLLSVKKDVKKADTAYWAQLVNAIDLATYQYKTDDNTSHIRLSSIVDDVNDTKQWQLPDVFVSRDEDGKLCGVDDSVLLNATLATVQEQQKEIDQLNGHNMELEARLNKLEAKLNG